MIDFIAILVILLFRTGYWICGCFYEKGSVPWWDLRFAIFTIVIALSMIVGYFGDKISIITKSLFIIGFVYLGGDIVDRYCFDIQSYQWNDLLLDAFAVLYLTIKITAQYAKTNRME